MGMSSGLPEYFGGERVWTTGELVSSLLPPTPIALTFSDLVTDKLVREIQWNPNRTREILQTAFAAEEIRRAEVVEQWEETQRLLARVPPEVWAEAWRKAIEGLQPRGEEE